MQFINSMSHTKKGLKMNDETKASGTEKLFLDLYKVLYLDHL